jgi:hypothetical protein
LIALAHPQFPGGLTAAVKDMPSEFTHWKWRSPIMTQVEARAKYAARASFADLSAESRGQIVNPARMVGAV